MAELKELTYDVPGVSCNHCVTAITNATKELGVNDVQVDLLSKKVYVAFDPAKIESEDIKDAIEEEGYEVTAEVAGKAIASTVGSKKPLTML